VTDYPPQRKRDTLTRIIDRLEELTPSLACHGEAPRSVRQHERRDGAYKRLGSPQTTAPHEEW